MIRVYIARNTVFPKVISRSIEEIRVLHVDDDPNQFEFIKFFLNQVDAVLDVKCVGTPDEVFKELDTGNYDCLVTDFQMPLMNGIDLSNHGAGVHHGNQLAPGYRRPGQGLVSRPTADRR